MRYFFYHFLIIFSAILLGIFSPYSAQTEELDEKMQQLENAKTNEEKANLHHEIANLQKGFNPQKTINHAEQAYLFTDNTSPKILRANILNIWGVGNAQIGKIDTALVLWNQALLIYKSENNEKKINAIKSNMALAYNYMGDFETALPYHIESLKYFESINDTSSIAKGNLNLGLLQWKMNKDDEALKSYTIAGELYQAIDHPALSSVYMNVGILYGENLKSDSARYFFYKALSSELKLGDTLGTAVIHVNIAETYLREDNPSSADSAIRHFNKSLEFQTITNELRGMIYSYKGLANAHIKLENYDKAEKLLLKSLGVARDINVMVEISQVYSGLYKLYAKQGIDSSALRYHLLYTNLKDSLFNLEKEKQHDEIHAQYEDEKKELHILSLEKDKEQQKIISQKESEQQQLVIVSISVGLVLVFLFMIFFISRYRITNRQKAIIANQKKTVDLAFGQLEEKNKEILDSINYAKRIQTAILPSNASLQKSLPDNFIFYLPKDIVAGDFYWLESVSNVTASLPIAIGTKQSNAHDEVASGSSNHRNEVVLFAAADCTGHGVPGAMVSVVCNNALNRAVREFGISKPGAVLDKARELVIAEFEKSEEDVKDGMDIALCSLEFLVPSSSLKVDTSITEEKQGTHFDSAQYDGEQGTVAKLQYAGAHNPLWIIRQDSSEELDYKLIEIKADRQPIGKFRKRTSFTTHNIELQKGDTIYIFTDGYVDQFGGERGKKFKRKQLFNLLLSMQNKPIEQHLSILQDAFHHWKKDLEQVDDICVIGIRI